MIFTRTFFKLCVVLVVILTLVNFIYIYVNKSKIYETVPPVARVLDFDTNEKVCWEDIDFINYEKTRIGPGEHGEEIIVTDPKEHELNQEWVKKEGFFVEVSNKMSLTRALPEHRPAVCPTKRYFQTLPNVSVIVTFHNEILSTLLRCIYSIYNRSPKQLLHEIILVNDKSTFLELYEPLQKFVNETFGDTVKIFENEERQGLIKARMTGAKMATGEVIIFLDSHMEVYNTWLPPLLDPLVTNPTFATVPVTDGMNHKTFSPQHTGYGYRGVFDWNFRYQWLPLRPQDRVVEGAPYELAAMTGGAYAIRRDHFFHLGGYDEGLIIWNGENWELSIKLWLCGGGMFEVPCSRVAHLSKVHSAYRMPETPMDFVGFNLKRVAEVWLDEYKEYLYRGDAKRFAKVDAGDLSKLFKKKKSLNCKPFKYFLDVVAPDMLEHYPIVPKQFASGAIKSMATDRCIGIPNYKYTDPIELVDCGLDHGVDFILTMERSIKVNDTNDQCLDATKLTFSNCHHQGGAQEFKFDLHNRQIVSSGNTKLCLSANTNENTISLIDCDNGVLEQKWTWKYENVTALDNWDKVGAKI